MIASPASGAVAITPHDTNLLAKWPTRGIYVGGAGAVKVTMHDGTVATFAAVAAGSILPFRVKIVWSAGTTATLMWALY